MRRRRAPQTSALPLSVLDVALGGWSAVASGDDADDAFAPFEISDWSALYRQHRALLDAEAKRRGLARPWAATAEAHGHG
jgi:hypothetical protein